MFDNLQFTPQEPMSRSDGGATAIEYAIIAGLIGLGIIGSLVTTKNSLNNVLGTTASQMTQSSTTAAAIPPASSSTRAPYWSAKTLASKVVSQPNATTQQTAYRYSDGSTVTYQKTVDASGNGTGEAIAVNDRAKGAPYPTNTYVYDTSGTLTNITYRDWYDAGQTSLHNITTAALSENWIRHSLVNGSALAPSTIATNDPYLVEAQAEEVYFRGASQ